MEHRGLSQNAFITVTIMLILTVKLDMLSSEDTGLADYVEM